MTTSNEASANDIFSSGSTRKRSAGSNGATVAAFARAAASALSSRSVAQMSNPRRRRDGHENASRHTRGGHVLPALLARWIAEKSRLRSSTRNLGSINRDPATE
jgi:hypothetical protein